MRHLLFLFMAGLFFMASCNEERISHKREGLKPYPQHEEDAKEAQEANK